MLLTLGLAFLAGFLSVLSPCVLPLLPLVLGSAASEHRLGPAALAAGLALSFTGIGLFVATVGFALGLDTDLFRTIAAFGLVAVGLVLLVPAVGDRLAAAAGPLADRAERRFGGRSSAGLSGQFGVGHVFLRGEVGARTRLAPPAFARGGPGVARTVPQDQPQDQTRL